MEWKTIPAHPDYSVSEDGHVHRKSSKFTDRSGRQRSVTERTWMPPPDKNGLCRFEICECGELVCRTSIQVQLWLLFGKVPDSTLEDIPGEKWVDIVGFPDYQISDMGRVKSNARFKLGDKGYYQLERDKILKHNILRGGYHQVKLFCNGNPSNFLVHRLVAYHFIDNPDNKPEVNHKFGNKDDNRASMIEWSSSMENTQHAERTGLANHYKTDEDTVRMIKLDLKLHHGVVWIDRILSEKYCVSVEIVYNIRTGKYFKHIEV